MGAMGWLERDSVDARFSLRGGHHPPSDVVLVGLDDSSLARLPRYPFSRVLHARVLRNLHKAGARLVVYDISFDRPTSQAADLALLDAAREAAPVVFSTSLISSIGATDVLGGNENLRSVGDQAAAADLLPDGDGVLRHTLADVNGLPSIAAAVSLRLTARDRTRQLRDGWIDFAGPPGTIRSLSFADILDNRFDPASIRGKVVVVGATAPALQDQHATAVGSPMPGPEVQANAIATALADFPLRSPSSLITTFLILLLALAVPITALELGTLWTCVTGVLCVVVWSLAAQLSFDSGVVLDYVDPLAAVLVGTGGTALLGMWVDRRERQRLRAMFAADAGGVVERVLGDGAERPIEPTAIIAGYQIEQVIGRGGMGVVYRARQLALDREVAVKLIASEHAKDPTFRERFKSESRIAASIEHPNVIPVYEAGEDDGLLFIAMRLVDGFDLAQLLAWVVRLEPARVARIVLQIAHALDTAHEHELVHSDVKPANVLLTVGAVEHAYLSDFGIAKRTGAKARITRTDQWAGTLDYMAPEQIRGEPPSAAADIYALTCVLYHCLVGDPPFPQETDAGIMWAHVSAPPPSPTAHYPDLPSEVDAIVARGMAKDPGERFPSAGRLAEACARALGLPIESAPSRPKILPATDSDETAQTLLSE